MNPIAWAVSRYKDFMWRREFARLPIKKLGNVHVKEMRGSLYVVDVEDITPLRLSFARNKALRVWEISKNNGEVVAFVGTKKEANRIVTAVNGNAR
jgi:hypothetical protein